MHKNITDYQVPNVPASRVLPVKQAAPQEQHPAQSPSATNPASPAGGVLGAPASISFAVNPGPQLLDQGHQLSCQQLQDTWAHEKGSRLAQEIMQLMELECLCWKLQTNPSTVASLCMPLSPYMTGSQYQHMVCTCMCPVQGDRRLKKTTPPMQHDTPLNITKVWNEL